MTGTRLPTTTAEEESQRLTLVLRMTERGFRLFPVEKRGKRPLIEGWPERATCDADVQRAWIQEYPGCNWGLACGVTSGVFVLDVDGPEGEAAIHELSEQYGNGWIETLSVKTARGMHYYFKYPEREIRNSASKLAPGLDVRGEGGYVLVPPSVHPSVTSYRWVRSGEDEQIWSAPSWLLEMLAAPAQRMGTTAVSGDIIPQGQRNATLIKLAGAMRRQG